MTFADVVMQAYDTPGLVANWERLYGMKLTTRPPRNAIEAMVDKAAGVPAINEDAARAFVRFVWDFVWTRLPLGLFSFVERSEEGCVFCEKEREGVKP